MEIIKLEFQGIGPFTDHHVIDFRKIGQSGLFLLEGPTGSGKTTILDAIVFALYGDVAGEDSSKDRIVSTMLPRNCEPFVNLVIDSNRGLLRVRRTPEYERPKFRGQGTTTSKATIKLWKLSSPDDPEGAPVSTNIAEANHELQQAIGLDKAQFTQTVMLPQGHFATFLRAKPDDRRPLLQDIFGTELYDRVAKKLNKQAQEHQTRMESARNRVAGDAANFIRVAWPDDAVSASEPIPEQVAFQQAVDAIDLDGLREGARRRKVELEEQVARAQRDAVDARDRHTAAADTLRALETRNDLIDELNGLHQRREELLDNEVNVKLDEAVLAAAKKAERVRRPIDNVEKSTETRDDARRKLDAEVERVREGSDSDLVSGVLSLEVLRSIEDAARVAAGQLDRVVTLEQSLPERRAAADQERQTLHRERDRIDKAREQIKSSYAEVLELENQLSVREAVATTLPSSIERQQAAKNRLDKTQEVRSLSSRLATARELELSAEAERQEAARRHEEARNAWLGAIAGELAADLVEGEPCAVCGSVAHPHPAVMPAGAVRREDVTKLAAALDDASGKAVAARSNCTGLVEQLEDQAKLVDGLTVEDAEAQFAAASKARKEAQQAVENAIALRERIESIRQTAQEDERRLQDDAKVIAASEATLAADDRQIALDQAEVTDQTGGYASVRDRQRALTARADTAHQISTLLTQLSTAETEVRRCASELAVVLAEYGFATADEAKVALLPEVERDRLARVVEAHRDEVTAVAAKLAQERYAGLDGATYEDPSPARDTEQQLAAEVREAHRLSGALENTARSAAGARDDLSGKIADFAKLRDAAGPLLRMANLANAGDANLQKVTLPTYVLLRRFEEVVERANRRLEAMTGGRYELRRTDDQEGRSRKLGLGLEVVDHQAHDLPRDPKTLSGGETFMASLSLALGLADAVMAEAGGIQLHTLFVDEGFGSLDSDTLDAVMQQLSALRAGGRSVGVVSHVEEMKQRIPERITVVPRGDGTSTLKCSTS